MSNRAGLRAVSYRSGTWAQFRRSMLDSLSTHPELDALRTRSSDDFTIALLDAWAVVCDILTFYQERIANESYLRTATETLSVGELAKLIGYKVRPGLAASAALAFTLDVPLALAPSPNTPPAGRPPSVVLPVATRGQTVPDPGMQPATFETLAPINVRAEWNSIGLRLRRGIAASWWNELANVCLRGLTTGLKAGDLLLVNLPGVNSFGVLGRVAGVAPDNDADVTVVSFELDWPPELATDPTTPAAPPVSAVLDDSFLWSCVRDHLWTDQSQFVSYVQTQGWTLDEVQAELAQLRAVDSPAATTQHVYGMGIRAALFGNNAMQFQAVPPPPTGSYTDWTNFTLADLRIGSSQLDLDAIYPITVGDQVVLQDNSSETYLGNVQFTTTVTAVTELTRSAFLLSSKVTRITLGVWPNNADSFGMRTTRVFVQNAYFPVADFVDDITLTGATVQLDGPYLSLAVGQSIALTGVRADKASSTESEVVSIAALSLVDGYTQLTVTPQLTGQYTASTVTINANVADATHGETTSEILGSGDATVAFQRFALKQPPLTYINASTPSGSASTLTVRVGGTSWTEVAWLSGAGPTDRVYTVLPAADGRTYVQFGDGVTGARPASGTNNIVASYRHGIGSAGLARAGQISTLLTRPLGLRAVTNPLATIGAADPETLDAARANAPMTVRSLDRIVSLADIADFAAASAGVAKASVHWIWDGARYVACATVAGIGGATIPNGSRQSTNLLSAMLAAGDGTLAVALCSYQPVTFTLAATITPDPSLVGADVLSAVKQALQAAFGFDARAFAQPVFGSEVVEVIQDVAGVVALTLDGLARSSDPMFPPAPVVTAAPPSLGPGGLVGAQLLSIDTGPLPMVVLA